MTSQSHKAEPMPNMIKGSQQAGYRPAYQKQEPVAENSPVPALRYISVHSPRRCHLLVLQQQHSANGIQLAVVPNPSIHFYPR